MSFQTIHTTHLVLIPYPTALKRQQDSFDGDPKPWRNLIPFYLNDVTIARSCYDFWSPATLLRPTKPVDAIDQLIVCSDRVKDLWISHTMFKPSSSLNRQYLSALQNLRKPNLPWRRLQMSSTWCLLDAPSPIGFSIRSCSTRGVPQYHWLLEADHKAQTLLYQASIFSSLMTNKLLDIVRCELQWPG